MKSEVKKAIHDTIALLYIELSRVRRELTNHEDFNDYLTEVVYLLQEEKER